MKDNLFSIVGQNLINQSAPLAEKLRPDTLSKFVGQPHLVSKGKPIQKIIEDDQLFSFVLWGPPGTGKTTLARIITYATKSHFEVMSATNQGLPRFKEVIKIAEEKRNFENKRTILFVDEIHRLNKAKQDAFLPYAENGAIIFIGATTENPSFYVNSALLSRMRVFVLNMLTETELKTILEEAKRYLNISIEEQAERMLIQFSDGDARILLNNIEFIFGITNKQLLKTSDIETCLQKKALRYDKSGEEHYNLISALHKSMRDSDADASLYWFTRMIEAGENPLYIARRMIRFASEDIGNADPMALNIAVSAWQSYTLLGSPEGELSLAQCVVYLARAKKSNEIYKAFKEAQNIIKETGSLPVPMHLRNAPTRLMKELGYGKGYKYAHNYKDAKVDQKHLPDEIAGTKFLD